MKKEIYSGSNSGFYCYGSFESFMFKESAEHIRSRFDLGTDLFQIWLLEGVLIHYRNNGKQKDGKTFITLYDRNTEKLEGVEKIILDGAKKGH
ncbi:MAG: hypothetical protein Q8Q04_02400 [archaeon]|nr:hypothetical protein [archaeon]